MLEYFYHGTVRKVVVGFASLFNNIHISRKNQYDQEIERIRVPIAYGPQQKFLRRLDRVGTDMDQQTIRLETYLPRMAFEISTLQYDSSRKMNSIQQTVGYDSTDRAKLKRRFERVPYNMTMTVSAMTKGMEDCLQIVEQILPYFTPEYVFTIKAIDGLDTDVDIPIVLSSVALTEGDDGSYGDYNTRKVNFATLQFVAKMNLYGPVKTQSVVINTNINIFDTNDFGKDVNAIKKYADIGVSAAAGITAGGYAPSLTAGWTGAGATHANVRIREYPPTAYGTP
jgi:hypothetical protein